MWRSSPNDLHMLGLCSCSTGNNQGLECSLVTQIGGGTQRAEAFLSEHAGLPPSWFEHFYLMAKIEILKMSLNMFQAAMQLESNFKLLPGII